MKTRIITIDGPSGTGKSTIAREVARELGFDFLDTGALYRGAALAIDEAGVDFADGQACADVVSKVTLELNNGVLSLNGRDISAGIRENRMSELSSKAAVHPEVRAALLELQRDFGRKHDTVAEGRDTGSVIFPAADLKLYLDASSSERARRRQLELEAKGTEISFEQIKREIEERDERDSNRKTSPLCIPEGAIVVDTTHMALAQVREEVLRLAREHLA